MKMPKMIENIFWDTDSKDINAKKHQGFIVTRIAEKGGLPEVKWLKKRYGLKTIKNEVSKSRNVSARTKNFWKLIG